MGLDRNHYIGGSWKSVRPLPEVKVKSIESRLGSFCVIKIGDTLFLTPCDTRMKIIQSLGRGEMTADQLTRTTDAAYSTVMDHMDVLERLGIVNSFIKREGGRRRIHFQLNERPAEQVGKLFAKSGGE